MLLKFVSAYRLFHFNQRYQLCLNEKTGKSEFFPISDEPNVNKRRASVGLQPLEDCLDSFGLNQIGEIFDGNYPHHPRGCIAQSWSVAQLLETLNEYLSASGTQCDRRKNVIKLEKNHG